MNKLMFYADFGHFKKYGQGIGGLYYKALPRDPVPENYGGIYNHIVNEGFARVEEKDFGEYVGERFVTDDLTVQETEGAVFSGTELSVMENISSRFKGLSTKQIVDISHEKPAWKDHVNDHNRISFEYGFQLKNVD